MVVQNYYLCFSINRLPDLTLAKYSVFDGSSVDNIMEKHGIFLRQLHRLGFTSNVYFHLLYYYNPSDDIPKGHHLSIIFYATSPERSKLNGIREFITTSVLSTYYDFYCYEVARDFTEEEITITKSTGTDTIEDTFKIIKFKNISGFEKKYRLDGSIKEDRLQEIREELESGKASHIICEIASDGDVVLNISSNRVDETKISESNMPVGLDGRLLLKNENQEERRFKNMAFLTKKDYSLPAQNRLESDNAGEVNLYSILEWEPSETGRLYNVLKLMEGYNQHAVLRVDIFPVEHTQRIRSVLPYADTRRRISDRKQGKDDNSENIIKSWDKYLNNLMKFPQFIANIVAFADDEDIAVMLADSVAAEAVESGTYLVESKQDPAKGYDICFGDSGILRGQKSPDNHVAPFLSLYTLEEIRPMFSFPILYPGESIECQKETDPVPFDKEVRIEHGIAHEVISLGESMLGYDVTFPVKLFKKHAFIAGVPGSGKTNTMLYLVTTLWRNTQQKVPFLVLEPAKQEYRALARIPGMEELCVFSPGADTKFPLHINPFEFPLGLTLAEHIANLNAVFAGAFELIPPSPFLIDSCIEKVYLDKGWNINERNTGAHEYPTMQELYDSLEIAVEESGYEGESKSNIRSVMEVRIGSLLRREIGNVYNVKHSSLAPQDWLSKPVIIELEALGEGPANFMSLLISTLIREVLKIKKTSDTDLDETIIVDGQRCKREVEHVIFYEEAHNLIGPTTDDPVGGSVDPKISATKYLVKMLAEVRALGEGIVIADQLPSAMAPEVLKNTGLKLGHRITAQDDRSMLGGTMSASADQLEEQGTFGVGEALIFYEDLLKPFKMHVHEWEKGGPSNRYDSPTNNELFEILKENRTYNILLSRSSEIMREKMLVEYNAQKEKAKKLSEEIRRKRDNLLKAADSINRFEKKLRTLKDPKEIDQVKKNLGEMQANFDSVMETMDGKITRELKKLCWAYNNLYYAYMTLSKNYYVYADAMYNANIDCYFTLFSELEILGRNKYLRKLQEILINETNQVIIDASRYIDFVYTQDNVILPYDFSYMNTFYDSRDYLKIYFGYQYNMIINKTEALVSKDSISENGTKEFIDEFKEGYFHLRYFADQFYQIVQDLKKELYEKSVDLNLAEQAVAHQRAKECETYERSFYEIMAPYVCKVFGILAAKADVKTRNLIFNETNDLRKSFREIVEYTDRNTKTLISDSDGYDKIWQGATSMLYIHAIISFKRLHDSRLNVLKSEPLDRKALSVLIAQYNDLFCIFGKSGWYGENYLIDIIDEYVDNLKPLFNLGEDVQKEMKDRLALSLKKYRELVNYMVENNLLDENKPEDENKIRKYKEFSNALR